VDRQVVFTALVGVSIAVFGVANKLGLWGPNCRAWQNFAFCTVWGVAFGVTSGLILSGSAITPLHEVIFALLGTLIGAIGGLLMSLVYFLDRRSAE
jgi:hypothetical protein